MKTYISIVALTALFGFSAEAVPTLAMAQSSPPMPSPTEDKDKDEKPSVPRAGDESSDSKKKDDRGSG
jgi:hypothetical protein